MYDRGVSFKVYKDGVVEASTGIANYALGTPVPTQLARGLWSLFMDHLLPSPKPVPSYESSDK